MLGNEHNEYQATYKCAQMYVSLSLMLTLLNSTYVS